MLFQGGRLVARSRFLHLGSSHTHFSSSAQERVRILSSSLYVLGERLANDKQGLTIPLGRRFFADGAASRPKAHTGRTTQGSKKTTTRKATAKGTKSKSAPKPKSKVKVKAKVKSKTKPRKRTKAKAKPKPKKKKVLTAQQKERNAKKRELVKARDLKEKALLDSPKAAPATRWSVFNAEKSKEQVKRGGATLGSVVKQNAADFKRLSPEQLEHYNQIANQNSASNKTAYRKWITSFSPQKIHEANNARNLLRRRQGKKGSSKYSQLRDERLVKHPRTAYISFSKERFATGDFKGMKLSEAAKLVGSEWKALSASEKKPYVDQAQKDLDRYKQEAQTVYAAK